MSYGVYHTDMIVLAATPRDEANVVFTLLTRDLGIIRAKAQSIRKITSKLRYGLQYLSQGTVDVIRAKDYWRIVGAEPSETLLPLDIHHKPLHNIIALVSRILPHDEVIDGLYEVILAAALMLSNNQSPEMQQGIEIASVARILSLGGYWNESLSTYLEKMHLEDSDIALVLQQKKQYLSAINSGLRHTHL